MQTVIYYCYGSNEQLHTVTRIYQGRQREPSVKTLRFNRSTKFSRHCQLNGGTQRRAFVYQRMEM